MVPSDSAEEEQARQRLLAAGAERSDGSLLGVNRKRVGLKLGTTGGGGVASTGSVATESVATGSNDDGAIGAGVGSGAGSNQGGVFLTGLARMVAHGFAWTTSIVTGGGQGAESAAGGGVGEGTGNLPIGYGGAAGADRAARAGKNVTVVTPQPSDVPAAAAPESSIAVWWFGVGGSDAPTSAAAAPTAASTSSSAAKTPGGKDGDSRALTADDGLSGPLDSTGNFNGKVKRTMSAKLKADQLKEILAEQRAHRKAASTARRGVDAKRARRVRAYQAAVVTLWEREWEYVQLTRLPSDIEKADGAGKRGVSEREPALLSCLAAVLQEAFQPLFDTYLYYCKVEADAAASELYRVRGTKQTERACSPCLPSCCPFYS